MTLEDYYREIQLRGGVGNPRALVGRWTAADSAHIEAELRQAIQAVGFLGKPLAKLRTKITNQAKGNAVADDLCKALKIDGSDVTIAKLTGGRGYPDRLLSSVVRKLKCCFEIKATSDWQDRDTNRRVITSSYSKLARAIDVGELPSPPCHLMGPSFTMIIQERRKN